MLNCVTGRSASISVLVLVGLTSVSHGDAVSCRRKLVNASMSTVRPSIDTRTVPTPTESASPGAPDAGAGGAGGAIPAGCPPIVAMPLSHVYGGSALVT